MNYRNIRNIYFYIYIFSLLMVNIKFNSLSLAINFSDCYLSYIEPLLAWPNHIKCVRDTSERV